MRLFCLFLFASAFATSCSTPRLQGSYQEEVEKWMSDSGGEYPVAYYRFSRRNRFDYRVIFCMLTDRGSGRYHIYGDEIRLVFGRQKLQDTPPKWDISDTTIVLKFSAPNDSTLLIGGTIFRRYR
jgi:hypothetical protein